ncbi:MAG: VOC family protein [Acidobacteria bacterium]|nr:VOC family protein [Acidobacteriota bacterium]
MFERLGFVMIVVSDLERSARFYRQILGRRPSLERPKLVEFDLGNLLFDLHLEDPLKGLTARHARESGVTIGFFVEEMDRAVAQLQRLGVKLLTEPQEKRFGKLALFEDPDGYVIQLAQLIR